MIFTINNNKIQTTSPNNQHSKLEDFSLQNSTNQHLRREFEDFDWM
jgi:hypothetical protein